MSDAVEDLKNKARDNNNDILDTAVSVDGTWQRRGYCSLNGVVTAISLENGKVIYTIHSHKLLEQCETQTSFRNFYLRKKCLNFKRKVERRENSNLVKEPGY